jgi:fructokinase
MAQVLCVGEALVDRLGPPGGDPASASADQCDDRLGGAPANVACALARLGTPAAFIGRLGTDAIGTAFTALFAKRGVNTEALQSDPQRPSRIVLVKRDATGERSFGGFAGDIGAGFADQALDADELAPRLEPLLGSVETSDPVELTRGCPGVPAWLLTGTIPLASAASAEALGLVLDRCEACGVTLAVDVNWRPTFWDSQLPPDAPPTAALKARLRSLLERADLLKCAAEEAEWLFGGTDPAVISAALPRRPDVLITDGANPVRWCVAGECGERAAFVVPVVDTTGAGDAFTAGLLHSFCAHPDWPVERRMAFASACGALVCGGAGAIDPQPTEDQVLSFMAAQGV